MNKKNNFKLAFFILAFLAFKMPALAQEVLPKVAPAPEDNPTTTEKVILGKVLFFDPRLSIDGTISCNSCHNVMAGGDDNRPVSVGVGGKKGGRSAPTVWNSAFLTVQFWDGRAATLEEQAKGPLVNPVEMAMPNHKLVVERIKMIPDYKMLFEKAFGVGDDKINIDNTAKAIAAYERTLIVPARFDKWLSGDKKALLEIEEQGFETAKTVGCFSCHMGPNFSGPQLPLGTGFYQQFPVYKGSAYDKKYQFLKDKGRFDVTKQESDKNKWRVASLRNIALTAPYFHNGMVQTLDEAVRVMAKTQLNTELKPEQVTQIVAFLKSLNSEFPKMEMPRLPTTEGYTLVK